SYIVASGNTLTAIASGLAAAVNADPNLKSIGVSATSSGAVVTINSTLLSPAAFSQRASSGATESVALSGSSSALASLDSSKSFAANPVLGAGVNTANITALSGGGTQTTNSYPVTIASATTISPASDADGNMTSDGTNSFSWD